MRYTTRLDNALKLSTTLHQGQCRKDAEGTPYSMHPVAVMCIAGEYTDDEDVLVAALLHDVLEDVELPYEEKEVLIRDNFGERVLTIVRSVSEEKDPMEHSDAKETWRERKLAYLKGLEEDGDEARIVCAADKIHNLMSMLSSYEKEGSVLWERFNSSADDRVWFYEEVLAMLRRHTDNPIVDELERRVNEFRAISVR